MRSWDNVYSVENIKFTVNDGQQEATIYGNTRNCVPVTVYFEGLDMNGDAVDLSKDKFTNEDIQLINQGTGVELPTKFGGEHKNGVIYSMKPSNFCFIPIAAPRAARNIEDYMEKRGSITFFVYGQADAKMSKTIGARFVFHDTHKKHPYSTAMDNRTNQFVQISVLPGVNYDMTDIEPFKWVESSRKNEYVAQFDGYIKLNDKHPNNRWIEANFGGHNYLRRFALQQNPAFAYTFFVWPLGLETTIKLDEPKMEVRYNKKPGALNITRLQGFIGGTPNFYVDIIIRLYDIFGNEGKFEMDWSNSDKTIPTIAVANRKF